MKLYYTLLFGFTLSANFLFGQILTPESYVVEIEPLVISNTPGIHSYSWGKTNDGKWIIIGGRIDGLHQRQPFAAFLEADNNKFAFVIDPVSEQSWSADLSTLSAPIFEQLQSTNQEFIQRDSTLYIFGGYGFSATAGEHVTYPNISAIDIEGLAQAIISGGSITSHFRQVTDSRMKVTGGQIGYLDSMFYLVGGQLFDGSYNPMGPNNGPGFTQEYTDEIRTFKILDDGTNMSITDYGAQNDALNLHRRDYNMAKQIFPNGEIGFTVFTGVFDPNDMPYLNTVDVNTGGYTVNNSFNQYLSQYHSAKIPIYDSLAQSTQTLFFGGMSQFYLENGVLVEDTDVPFVKTVSKVTRFNDGSMAENALTYLEMPALLGAGAEFIPSGDYLIEEDLIDINAIPNQKTLIGYIYGGIESTDKNIFFINDGTQSSASNVIFEVFINKTLVGMEEYLLNSDIAESKSIFPNPAKKNVTFSFAVTNDEEIRYEIISTTGKVVKVDSFGSLETGTYDSTVDISDLEAGTYILQLYNGNYFVHYKFVKK